MSHTELSTLISISNDLYNRKNADLRNYYESLSLQEIKTLQLHYRIEKIEPPFAAILESSVSHKEWDFAVEFFKKFPEATKLSRKIEKADDYAHYTHMGEHGFKVSFQAGKPQIQLDHSFVFLNGEIYELASGKNYLGEGGFANVKEGRTRAGEVVAIKIEGYSNHPEDNTELEMLTELGRLKGQAIRELSQPRQFKKSVVESKSYMAMTLIPGSDLRKILRGKSLSHEEAVIVAINIMIATKELHDRSIVHRDIKPDNFMIESNLNATIIDLNISRRMLPESNSYSGHLVGTPGYFPPETQSKMGAKVNYTKQSDIWSLGTSLLNAHDLNLGFLNSELIKSMTNEDPNERPSIIKVLIELSTIAENYPAFTQEHKQRLRDLANVSLSQGEIDAAERDLLFKITEPKPVRAVSSHDAQHSARASSSYSVHDKTVQITSPQPKKPPNSTRKSFLGGLFGMSKNENKLRNKPPKESNLDVKDKSKSKRKHKPKS